MDSNNSDSNSVSSLSDDDMDLMEVGSWTFEVDDRSQIGNRYFNRHTVIKDCVSYYYGAVHGPNDNGPYHAYCTLAPLDLMTAHDCDKNRFDEVVIVSDDSINTFKRTRYRACCSPVIVQVDDTVYAIINTDLNRLTVYSLPDGKEICTIKAPEMMTAILPDSNSDNSHILHLFGWVWSPLEVYYPVNLREILDKAK